MTNPEEDGKLTGAENEKNKSELEESIAVDVDPDESKAQLINGGAGGDEHDKYKIAIADPGAASSDGEVSFNGLGKDEVLQYANDPFWVKLRWILFILFWVGWLAMLVAAIAIIVLAPRCPDRPDLKWYHTDNIYQVYGKSFKDGNNDGRGDFKGLDDKMEYITDADDLDTKAMWLSGILNAEIDENGVIGVIDHKALNQSFIEKDDEFKSWVKKQRKEGKKVILDLIPNHTSKKHAWFQSSVKEEGKYKDYYVWVAGTANNPPNDWKIAGTDDSAWTFDKTRNAFYLHQVSKEFPDLDLENEDVVQEIKDIMEYWFDAGISGFNIRDVEYLVTGDVKVNDDAQHSQTRNHNNTIPFLVKLREVAEDFSDKPGRERVLFATLTDATRAQVEAYWGVKDKEGLHIVNPILRYDVGCDAECVKGIFEKYISEDTEEEQWLGLQMGDINLKRLASHLDNGDGSYKHRILNALALQLLMPGTPFIYYGDEFGQRDGAGNGSDKYHAIMQWDKTANAGFTSEGTTPWTLPSPYYEEDNAETGRLHFTETPFETYQKLTSLRKEESLQFGKTKVCTASKNLLMFSRKASRFPYFVILINLGTDDETVPPSDLACLVDEDEEEAVIRFHSRDEDVGDTISLEDHGLHLEGFDVVVLGFAADD